jgi:hypothetical protein
VNASVRSAICWRSLTLEVQRLESSNNTSRLPLPYWYRGESTFESSPSLSIGCGAGRGVARRDA